LRDFEVDEQMIGMGQEGLGNIKTLLHSIKASKISKLTLGWEGFTDLWGKDETLVLLNVKVLALRKIGLCLDVSALPH
jgi:hypothetical protein